MSVVRPWGDLDGVIHELWYNSEGVDGTGEVNVDVDGLNKRQSISVNEKEERSGDLHRLHCRK